MARGDPSPPTRGLREDGGPQLTVTVRLAPALRQHVGGTALVELDVAPPTTIRAVLDALAAAYPAVGRRLRDESGALRTHVNVFIGADNVRDLDGADPEVPEGVEVAVLAAISGGAP